MGKKAKNYISVLITVLFCAGMLSISAFAAGGVQSLEGSSSSGSSSGSSSSASQASSSSSAGTPSQGTGSVDVPSKQSGNVTVTLDFNGGAGGTTRVVVKAGTPVDDLASPTRKGYKFAGWSLNGNAVSSSLKLNEDTLLTARWAAEESSDVSSSRKPSSSSSQKPVDTHQSEVDRAASRAEQVISEPDTLSSQDWNSLLNSSSSSAAAGTLQSSQASSSQAKAASGLSKLFLLGIGLIVLALAGIGLFIYLQFIRGRRGPRGGGPSDADNTMEFTDISSYSNGDSSHDSPYDEFDRAEEPAAKASAPVKRTVPAAAKKRPAHLASSEETLVMDRIPARKADPRKTASFPIPTHAENHPKAQARPVTNAKDEFDWEKFFEDDN